MRVLTSFVSSLYLLSSPFTQFCISQGLLILAGNVECFESSNNIMAPTQSSADADGVLRRSQRRMQDSRHSLLCYKDNTKFMVAAVEATCEPIPALDGPLDHSRNVGAAAHL